MKKIEEKIRKEEEMFDISEENAVNEETFDERKRKSRKESGKFEAIPFAGGPAFGQ